MRDPKRQAVAAIARTLWVQRVFGVDLNHAFFRRLLLDRWGTRLRWLRAQSWFLDHAQLKLIGLVVLGGGLLG